MTKSGSGSLVVRRAASGSVKANGASGSITIGVEQGTAAWLDVSTLTCRIIQEVEQTGSPTDVQQRVEITAHTVSGDLRVYLWLMRVRKHSWARAGPATRSRRTPSSSATAPASAGRPVPPNGLGLVGPTAFWPAGS